jgi:hypothetical protein
MEKLRIEDLKKDLYLGDLGEYFNDYDNGYICDIISEIAGNNVDIYNYDLLEWAKGNYSYIEEALDEFGTPTDGNGKADFLKIIQQGQYYANERDLYDNLEDSLKFFMYDYIEKTLKIEKITENQNDGLLDFDFSDNNEMLENLIEHISEVIETKEEE